jgi:uncharacterized protein YsxB (DUF464 family)
MTKVTIGQQYIKIEGHAGYSDKGTDIVCAAVSALGQSLKHIDELYREFNVSEENATLRVDFHSSDELVQSFAFDRKEYLKEQVLNKDTPKKVKREFQAELEDWDNHLKKFAHLVKMKTLIIQNQVDLIVKAIKEIAKDYPEHVEVTDV